MDLTQGEFDIGIRNGRGDWPGLTAHFLLPSLYTPLCSPALVESGALTSPADLAGLPRMGRERWWRVWLAAAGAAAREPELRTFAAPATEQAAQ